MNLRDDSYRRRNYTAIKCTVYITLYDTYDAVKRCGYNYQTILIVILLSNNTEASVK